MKGKLELTLTQVSIKTLSKETVNEGECFFVQTKDLVKGKQTEEDEIVAYGRVKSGVWDGIC